MTKLPEVPPGKNQEMPSAPESSLPSEDLMVELSEKSFQKNKPITFIILLSIVVIGLIGYFVLQNSLMKSEKKIVSSQPKNQPLVDIQQPAEGILREINQLDELFESDEYYVDWKRVNQNMRFHMDGEKGDKSRYLGRSLDSLEETKKLYDKISFLLKENSFTVDPTRTGHFSGDGGGEFISNEVWTNDSQFLLINVYRIFEAPADRFFIEINNLGSLKLVETVEKEQTQILNEFLKIKSGSFDNLWKWSYIFTDKDGNAVTTKIFSGSNQNRYFSIIRQQAGESNFLYFSKNIETGVIKGLLAGHSPESDECDELKKLNITQSELNKIVSILEEEDLSWYFIDLGECQLDG